MYGSLKTRCGEMATADEDEGDEGNVVEVCCGGYWFSVQTMLTMWWSMTLPRQQGYSQFCMHGAIVGTDRDEWSGSRSMTKMIRVM